MKDGKIIYIITILVLIVLILGLFRDSIFSGNTGTITIDHLDENSTIFLDDLENRRINQAGDNIKIKRITPGLHKILISRDGFWPWLKEVELEAGENVAISPFFAFTNTTGFLIGSTDPEYDDLKKKLEKVVLPDFENKKISEDGSIAIWVGENTLFVEWLLSEDERPDFFCNDFGCHSVMVSLGVGGGIRNVDFYKSRSDVVIVSFGNGIFAMEIDTSHNQNFQPIFEGQSPQFIGNDNNSIYLIDNNILRQVAL